jgi:hypothetical protein
MIVSEAFAGRQNRPAGLKKHEVGLRLKRKNGRNTGSGLRLKRKNGRSIGSGSRLKMENGKSIMGGSRPKMKNGKNRTENGGKTRR